MRSAYGNYGAFNRASSEFFGFVNGFVDALHGFVELSDDAFARSARIDNAVAAITQAGVSYVANQGHSFGAAYIEDGNRVGVLFHGPLIQSCRG